MWPLWPPRGRTVLSHHNQPLLSEGDNLYKAKGLSHIKSVRLFKNSPASAVFVCQKKKFTDFCIFNKVGPSDCSVSVT